MFLRNKYLILVLMPVLCFSVTFAKTTTAPAKEPVFKTVADIQQFYNNKIKESRKTIEIQRMSALEKYLVNAPASERLQVLLNMFNTAMFLGVNDRLISLSDTIIKDYPTSSDIWQVRSIRYDSLANMGKLEQARSEWEKAGAQVNMDNWEGILQAAMLLADRYIETGNVDRVKAIYSILRKKMTFISDLNTLLTMKENQLFWVGRFPPALEGKDLNGETIDLKEYRGKVVLLDFWATWCGPCITQMPHLLQLYREYRSQGFEIIGISLDQNLDAMKNFIEKNQIPWRQLFDQQSLSGANARKYQVSGIPATFLIGRDGKILYGSEPTTGYGPVLSRLLAKPAAKKQ
ncbi:MAG: peroxiredoxin family protein [Planctomycetota bacterium]|jgi:peroxiredoxin